MKIAKLKELDVGVSGVQISGDVTYAKLAKNWQGTKNGRAYNFWSQFVAIEDSNGSIGCNITFPKEENSLEEGATNITIKGKVDEYTDNNGEVQKSISSGRVMRNKETKEATGSEKTNVKENELHIIRECAIKAVTELVCADKVKHENFFPCAERIVKYITGGYHKKEAVGAKAEGEGPKEEVPPEDIPEDMTEEVPF